MKINKLIGLLLIINFWLIKPAGETQQSLRRFVIPVKMVQDSVSYFIVESTDLNAQEPHKNNYFPISTEQTCQDRAMLIQVALERCKIGLKIEQSSEQTSPEELADLGTIEKTAFNNIFTIDGLDDFLFWIVPEQISLAPRAQTGSFLLRPTEVNLSGPIDGTIQGSSIKKWITDFHTKKTEAQIKEKIESIQDASVITQISENSNPGTIILPICDEGLTPELWSVFGFYNNTKNPFAKNSLADDQFKFFYSKTRLDITPKRGGPSSISASLSRAATAISSGFGRIFDSVVGSDEYKAIKQFMVTAMAECGVVLPESQNIGQELFLIKSPTEKGTRYSTSPDIIVWRVNRETNFQFKQEKSYFSSAAIDQLTLGQYLTSGKPEPLEFNLQSKKYQAPIKLLLSRELVESISRIFVTTTQQELIPTSLETLFKILRKQYQTAQIDDSIAKEALAARKAYQDALANRNASPANGQTVAKLDKAARTALTNLGEKTMAIFEKKPTTKTSRPMAQDLKPVEEFDSPIIQVAT